MSIASAIKCFDENTKLINPQQDPVAWNLNNGLLNLCREVQQNERDLGRKIQNLESILRNLEYVMRR